MLKFHNPNTLSKPFSRYTHVVTAPEGCRWVHISGQVGATVEGAIPEGFEAQARQTWENVLAAVRAGGMDIRDIVKANIFLTRREDIQSSRMIRDEMLEGHAPASTMLLVSGLALPSLLLEIEVVAARPMAAKLQAGAKRTKPARKAVRKTKAKARAKPRRR
jgi:enamine deaminase RidA (YjgF/YER057c/UK114 family)